MKKREKILKSSNNTYNITVDVILHLGNKVFKPGEIYEVSDDELKLIKETTTFKKGFIQIK